MKFEPYKRFLPVLVLIAMVAAGLWLLPGDAKAPAQSSSDHGDSDQPGKTLMDYGSMLLQLLLVLAGICGLAWLSLRWVLPRLYGSPGSDVRHIRILENYRLDNRRSLFLVNVAGEILLLAASEQGIHFLTRVEKDLDALAAPGPTPPAAPAPAVPERKPSFIEVLLRKKP